ncbi:MAG: carboxylesterase family protein [Planctomycetaceae bacterium]|nr:carboxylesterase family protein [Planctomycetaceae bacterium]
MSILRLLLAGAAVLVVTYGSGGQEDAIHRDEARELRWPPLLQIDSGPITGIDDDRCRVFLGIPYAAPPVGPLRWRPPAPVKPWQTVRNCTAFGPSCPQPASRWCGGLGPVSEDCLYLNVFTPLGRVERALPVLVWIHGGGNATGTASAGAYDARELARRGAVVVTINYRVGALGFLAHPLLSKESARGVSGNYGLLDQIAALKWVQRNIVVFGGDPTRVTIFGESAGGMNVCRLMVCPAAKGLFQRAISQSGAVHGRNRKLRQEFRGLQSAESLGEDIFKSLGCSGASDPLAAARRCSADDVATVYPGAVGLFQGGTRYGPVIDGWLIPEDPVKLFAKGRQHRVPLIVGNNADEGTLFIKSVPLRNWVGFRTSVRIYFGENTDAVLKVFPMSDDESVAQARNELVTVAAFVVPSRFAARSMTKARSSAWLYQFSRVPPGLIETKMGAFHGLEIAYVFGHASGRIFDSTDRALSESIMDYWINFANTGNPNAPYLPYWPAYDAVKDQYMDFIDRPRVKKGLYARQCDLLDRIPLPEER